MKVFFIVLGLLVLMVVAKALEPVIGIGLVLLVFAIVVMIFFSSMSMLLDHLSGAGQTDRPLADRGPTTSSGSTAGHPDTSRERADSDD